MMSTGDRESVAAVAARGMAARDLAAATEGIRGTVPIHHAMGLTVVGVDEDRIVMTMELTDAVRGAAEGSIHGGLLATFADAASAMVLTGSFEPDAQIPVTTDIHVRYYRQPKGGPLAAEARVVHRGRRILSTECSIVDAEQRVLSRSTATYMIVPL